MPTFENSSTSTSWASPGQEEANAGNPSLLEQFPDDARGRVGEDQRRPTAYQSIIIHVCSLNATFLQRCIHIPKCVGRKK